jgi:hypothetical protein
MNDGNTGNIQLFLFKDKCFFLRSKAIYSDDLNLEDFLPAVATLSL